MCKKRRRVLLLNKDKGFTLTEMIVTLGILAILAAMALPYAEKTIKRSKEMELSSALRTIRKAIDEFHTDWEKGTVSNGGEFVSEDGYPVNLEALTIGVETSGAVKKRIKYLRKIPRDPFANQSIPAAEQWALRSYSDMPDAGSWGGQDVYDVYTNSERKAINGSYYYDW